MEGFICHLGAASPDYLTHNEEPRFKIWLAKFSLPYCLGDQTLNICGVPLAFSSGSLCSGHNFL